MANGHDESRLSGRIRTILAENGLRESEFAAQMGITPSYVSMLLSGGTRAVSAQLARQIALTYGYCEQWVLQGIGKKRAVSGTTPAHEEAVGLIRQLDERDALAVTAYIETLLKLRSR